MNIDDFIDFLNKCPTQYHLCEYIRTELLKCGFTELEFENWDETPKKAFFLRNGKEIFAWNNSGSERAIITGAHCDSPCLTARYPFFDEVRGGYRRCRCNAYGPGLWDSWFDRDLRLAGQVLIRYPNEKNKTKSLLFDSEVGIATIPIIAPHLGMIYKPVSTNEELIPIYGAESRSPPLIDYIASKLNIEKKDIVSCNLHFIDSDPSSIIFDQNDSIIHSQRLSVLHNTYSVFKSFINSIPETGNINMMAIFEKGLKEDLTSTTDIINTTLQNILHLNSCDFCCFKANSFFVNCKSFQSQNEKFFDISNSGIGKGVYMQRSSAIKSVSNLKNDSSIHEAIQNIIIESKLEKEADQDFGDQNESECRPRYPNSLFENHFIPNRGQPGSYRIETPKELTEEDDRINNQSNIVFIPESNSLFCKYADNSFIYNSKRIHEINKLYQSKLDHPITNNEISNKTNENASNKTNENSSNKTNENSSNKTNENASNKTNENINNKSNENTSNKTNENISNKTNENTRIKVHRSEILHKNIFRSQKRNLQDKGKIRKEQDDFNILSIDIGVPIIGMNSIRELGSFSDIEYEYIILSELFSNYSKHAIP